jgi:hypothetical protein
VVPLKKSYSSLNLLQEKLAGFTEPKGFFGFLFSNRKYLTITLPYYEFLRGKIFLEDLRDNFVEETPPPFGLDDLIYLLYNDLLTQIKRGVASPEQIAQYLLTGVNRYFLVPTIEKRIMKPITQTSFEFEIIEEEDIEVQQEKGKTAYITIRMKESEILRAEVLLHDLEPYLEGKVSIEQVIAITYLDFIEKVKSGGNSLTVQRAILNRLKS